MKKSILILFATIIMASSCTDDLNKTQLIGISDENFYSTQEDAIASISNVRL